MNFKAIVSTLTLLLASPSWSLTVPKILKPGMVLQQEPFQAHLWGGLEGMTDPVRVKLQCQSGLEKSYLADQNNDDTWSIELEPMKEGELCDISITQDGNNQVIPLQDVLFGDVFVCSGQSNMQMAMVSIFNATEEIAATAAFSNIRMYKVKTMTSDTEQDDLMIEDGAMWFKSDEPYVKGFSAVCLLTARYISEILGKDKAFGLIESSWGGTRVEAWSTPNGLEACGVEPNIDETYPQHSNSYLYNAMIHPLFRFTIKSVLWYQGESNAGWNRDLYQCTFPTLINEWRRLWSEHSPTSTDFPFGFVQLATNRAETTSPGTPVIRWHQTVDKGVVPNDQLRNVFMSVSLDTYDAENGIHPRNKQLVSERLAIAGLNIAYGMTEFPANGPFPKHIDFSLHTDGFLVDIEFDQPFTWNPIESEGFYVCCSPTFEECDSTNGAWEEMPDGSVIYSDQHLSLHLDDCAKGLAYLWRESPVLGTRALPIYSVDSYGLPAAPWKAQVAV